MLPWLKVRQDIFDNAAQETEMPHWAGEAPENVTIKVFKRDHTVFTQSQEKLRLRQSYLMVHPTEGSIPYREHLPAIKGDDDSVDFPYKQHLSLALADRRLTLLAQVAGLEPKHRVRIGRMDSNSWTIFVDDTEWDETPITVSKPHGGHPCVEASAFEKMPGLNPLDKFAPVIASYRLSPEALEEHNEAPTEPPVEEKKEAKRKRFLNPFR